MTQLQLWVVIAAPSVLALIGILLNQSGLHRLNSRIDRLECRMDRLEGRMDRMMEILAQ
jgi:hypothetical protein